MPKQDTEGLVTLGEFIAHRAKCSSGMRWAIRVGVMVLLALVAIAIGAAVRHGESQAATFQSMDERMREQETTSTRIETRQEYLIGEVAEVKAQGKEILKEIRQP